MLAVTVESLELIKGAASRIAGMFDSVEYCVSVHFGDMQDESLAVASNVGCRGPRTKACPVSYTKTISQKGTYHLLTSCSFNETLALPWPSGPVPEVLIAEIWAVRQDLLDTVLGHIGFEGDIVKDDLQSLGTCEIPLHGSEALVDVDEDLGAGWPVYGRDGSKLGPSNFANVNVSFVRVLRPGHIDGLKLVGCTPNTGALKWSPPPGMSAEGIWYKVSVVQRQGEKVLFFGDLKECYVEIGPLDPGARQYAEIVAINEAGSGPPVSIEFHTPSIQ